MSATRYVRPSSLDETLNLLAGDPQARLLAGGYNLLLPKNRRGMVGKLLVDLRTLPELAAMELQPDGNLRIGAMTTIGAIGSNEIVRARFPALAESAELVGDAQVRNRATLGGSLATAEPESDLPALMLALDAQLLLKAPGGTRTVAAEQFFTGPQQTTLGRDEMISTVELAPLPSRSGMAYEKFKHPATLYALCGVAETVTVGEEGSIARVRVGATGALSYPMRLHGVEETLLKTAMANGALYSLAVSLPNGVPLRDDFFASADYRRHLLEVLTRRALKRALERAAA